MRSLSLGRKNKLQAPGCVVYVISWLKFLRVRIQLKHDAVTVCCSLVLLLIYHVWDVAGITFAATSGLMVSCFCLPNRLLLFLSSFFEISWRRSHSIYMYAHLFPWLFLRASSCFEKQLTLTFSLPIRDWDGLEWIFVRFFLLSVRCDESESDEVFFNCSHIAQPPWQHCLLASSCLSSGCKWGSLAEGNIVNRFYGCAECRLSCAHAVHIISCHGCKLMASSSAFLWPYMPTY